MCVYTSARAYPYQSLQCHHIHPTGGRVWNGEDDTEVEREEEVVVAHVWERGKEEEDEQKGWLKNREKLRRNYTLAYPDRQMQREMSR